MQAVRAAEAFAGIFALSESSMLQKPVAEQDSGFVSGRVPLS